MCKSAWHGMRRRVRGVSPAVWRTPGVIAVEREAKRAYVPHCHADQIKHDGIEDMATIRNSKQIRA
jgi:hypothetical protein